MTNLSNEEITTKAGELSQRENCKVHPLVFMDGEEQIIGFIKEPPRHVKLRVMDKGLTSPATAAAEIVDAYLLKADSDVRIYDENPNNDNFYLGATMEAYNMVSMAVNQFKKK